MRACTCALALSPLVVLEQDDQRTHRSSLGCASVHLLNNLTQNFYPQRPSKRIHLKLEKTEGHDTSLMSLVTKPTISAREPGESKMETLYLEHSCATLTAPNQNVSVFFDECNREIVTLTNDVNSITKVVFQAADQPDVLQFNLPTKKRILSLKLNPTRTVLAYHVERNIVELTNVIYSIQSDGSRTYKLDDKRYSQAAKSKNSKLFGFVWASSSELVMISDIDVEYFHVDAGRRHMRFVKAFLSSTNWFVYHPASDTKLKSSRKSSLPHSVLMVSTGSTGTVLQPYLFMRRTMTRLQKFEVEGIWKTGEKEELLERSISIVCLYGVVRLLVLRNQSLNIKTRGAQILIYSVDIVSGLTSKTHILDLDVDGKFAINVLDNLVIAHDQPSKSSFIFDIKIKSTERSDCDRHHVSLLERQTMRPLRLRDGSGFVKLYSSNWVFFQPHYIIDAKLGMLCTLHIDLNAIQEQVRDDQTILNFLTFRNDAEQVILRRIKQVVDRCLNSVTSGVDSPYSPLADISTVFELLSKLVTSSTFTDSNSAVGQEVSSTEHIACIRQEDVYQHIFGPYEPIEEKVSLDSGKMNQPLQFTHFGN